MKTFLSLLIIIGGAVALYFLYSYALNSTPQLTIKTTNNIINKNESFIIKSYLTNKLNIEKNKTKNSKNLSITSVLHENNKTFKSPKKLFKDINITTQEYTIQGTLEP